MQDLLSKKRKAVQISPHHLLAAMGKYHQKRIFTQKTSTVDTNFQQKKDRKLLLKILICFNFSGKETKNGS